MKSCELTILDMVNVKFSGLDAVVRRRMNEALKFMVPNARHTPQFKLKRWDGKVSFGTIGGATYINMLDRVLPIVMEAGYDIEIIDKRPQFDFYLPQIDENYLADRVWPVGHELAGLPIMLRDYQVEAVNRYFSNQSSLQCLATGAGKTIITASLSLAVERATGGRTIVIVPSKSLVEQTAEDYINVGLDTGLFYGDSKTYDSKHVIATWQSLSVFDKNSKKYNLDMSFEEFMSDVKCVIVDECHMLKGKVLLDMLCGPMANVPIRWGMTGTIPKEEYEFMALLSSVGPVVGEIRAADLQAKEVLANCKIEIMELQDQHVEFNDYDAEHRFLTTDPDRLKWTADYCQKIAQGDKGNILILVNKIATGKLLKDLIPDSVFISGVVKTKDRKKEYDEVKTVDHKVIIATYGVAAVGISINRLFTAVLFEPGKSFVRCIQSCGRLLRRSKDKTDALIIDLTSSLKYSKRHLAKRKEYYRDEKYPYTVTKVIYR